MAAGNDSRRFSCLNLLSALASRLTNRRSLASFIANPRFVFSLAATSIIAAKLLHIYIHVDALRPSVLLAWGISFFWQDTIALILLRLLLDVNIYGSLRWLRAAATTLASLVTVLTLVLATVNISFFAVAGSEVHWRNVGFAGDKSSRKVLLSGLASCLVTLGVLLGVAALLQDLTYVLAGAAIDCLAAPPRFVVTKVLPRIPIPLVQQYFTSKVEYSHIPQSEGEEGGRSRDLKNVDPAPRATLAERLLQSRLRTPVYALMAVFLISQLALPIARPKDGSMRFMSWTLPLLPIVDFTSASSVLVSLQPVFNKSINRDWDDRSALGEPVDLPWLPKGKPPAGFEDWYGEDKTHYRASQDPLKISNLEDDLLPDLQGKLGDVKIRHVLLIKAESTRKDVFPIKKDGLIYNKLSESWGDGNFPEEAHERMATLTKTANFLTGDYDDGFNHTEEKRRGSINCNNVFTTATYTRKSMTGTLCGITPLVADFNVEWMHNIYQPCMPQIFDAFNRLDHGEANGTDDFTTFPWRSMMMQSTTDSYDKQHEQMPYMGYSYDNFVHRETINRPGAKYPNTLPDINYYGPAESAVEDYLRDAFVQAKEKKERLFLTHFTSTTHHPFKIPEEEEYVKLDNQQSLSALSHYVNAVGFVDRWLGRVLELLEEEGVGDETLVVLVGDHGISIAEDHHTTAYYAPNIGNFHVPLILSHPKLPNIDIDTAVESLQILPTIMDLLRESGSLSDVASGAAWDLANNYEGQSLIRPLRLISPTTGKSDWQFSLANPGRAFLSARSADRPEWRLVVPIVQNSEWRFTDLAQSPHEEEATVAFGYPEFLQRVEEQHGIEAAHWAEEAAFMARWWVEDNMNRYQYIP